jgi:hypothetical protein
VNVVDNAAGKSEPRRRKKVSSCGRVHIAATDELDQEVSS